MTDKKKTEAETAREETAAPIPVTQVKATEDYTDEPMTKAPTKSGVAAFDGEEGLRARNATMEPHSTREAGSQTETASKAKRG